ncbi:MAG: hypothetical protein WBH85_10055, partial [Thermoanaerobaculia bacterium]
MTDLQHEPFFFCERNDFLRLGNGACHRLFQEKMFATLQSFLSDVIVRTRGRRYHDAIHIIQQ